MDDDPFDHMMLMSARDQIATNRRCEHRRGKCLANSMLYRDCECLKSALIRAERKHRRRGPPAVNTP